MKKILERIVVYIGFGIMFFIMFLIFVFGGPFWLWQKVHSFMNKLKEKK